MYMSSNVKIISIPIQDIFKLPIYYISKKEELKNHIISDLELINITEMTENKDVEPNKHEGQPESQAMYTHAFQPKSEFGSSMLKEVTKLYSHDVDFLRDTQLLFKTFSSTSIANYVCQENQKSIRHLEKKYIRESRKISYKTGLWNFE